jgi:succinate dehydrogenase / fumarate reductase cytochrome b subunit
MNIIANCFNSSLGKKVIMAVSGCALFCFVVGHLLGNLQVFLGPEAINGYGHFLQSKPVLLWSTRLGLLALVLLHIGSALKLSAENQAARPIGYADAPVPPAASYASRTMLMSGLIIGAFVIFHLLHFTVQLRTVNLSGQDFRLLQDEHGRHDVYRMMVIGFSHRLVSAFYIAAMALLFLHLSHGVSAMCQSVGLKNRKWGTLIDRFAKVAAWMIFAGYISIPIAILLGYGKEALR